MPVRRFDAMQPLSEIVDGLNLWQPENLIAYASMAKILANEQLAGRLRIHPNAVMCSSEVSHALRGLDEPGSALRGRFPNFRPEANCER